MRNTHALLAGAALSAALAALPVEAQLSLTPRALGTAGAHGTAARGHEALFLNPATLALPGAPHWSAGIPTLAVGAAVRGLTLSDVADLVRYDELDDTERRRVLDAVPAGGTGVDVEVRAPLVALQVRRFAVGIGYGVMGNHTVDRSMVDLLLNGFDPEKRYSVEGTTGFRADYWDFAAAYGHRIGPVSVGATARYLVAGDLVRSGAVALDTVFLGPVPTDARVTYAGTRSSGGSGVALDLGAAMEPYPGLTVGLSLSNAVSTLRWDGEVRVRTVVLDGSDYEDGDVEGIMDRFRESDRLYDEGSADPGTRALAALLREDREAGLPSVLRLGASFEPGTGTTLSAAYQGELRSNAFSGMWSRSLAAGVQQRVLFLTLRAGVATDLDAGAMLSGGLSLGPIELGAARISAGSDDDRRNGWMATVGLSARAGSVMP